MNFFGGQKKISTDVSKLRRLKIYTYIQNKLESLMQKDPLLVDTLNGNRIDIKDPEKEDYDLALARILIESGKLTEEEIEIVLRSFFSHGMGSEGTKDYFKSVLKKANNLIKGEGEEIVPIIKTGAKEESLQVLTEEMLFWLAEKKKTGELFYKTGFSKIDRILEKIPSGSLVVVSGKCGTGKTSFFLQLAKNLIEAYKVTCGYMHYDQPLPQMMLMMISQILKEPYGRIDDILSENEFFSQNMKEIRKEVEKINNYFYFIETHSLFTMEEAEKYFDENTKDIVFIDSLAGIPSRVFCHGNIIEKIDRVLPLVRMLAKRTKTTVFVSVPIDVAKKEISPYADIYIHLAKSPENPAEIDFDVIKNRFGPENVSETLSFNAEVYTFSDEKNIP